MCTVGHQRMSIHNKTLFKCNTPLFEGPAKIVDKWYDYHFTRGRNLPYTLATNPYITIPNKMHKYRYNARHHVHRGSVSRFEFDLYLQGWNSINNTKNNAINHQPQGRVIAQYLSHRLYVFTFFPGERLKLILPFLLLDCPEIYVTLSWCHKYIFVW